MSVFERQCRPVSACQSATGAFARSMAQQQLLLAEIVMFFGYRDTQPRCTNGGGDARDRRNVGDLWGHRLMLRGNGPESSSRRQQAQDCHDEAVRQARITAQEAASLESSGSFGYAHGLRSNKWEIPVQRACTVGCRVDIR